MNKTVNALKLAEEALQTALDGMGGSYGVWSEKCKPALAAIREALADHSGDANEMVAEPTVKDYLTVAEPALKECRHCGFLCKPNPDESKPWYPLAEQAMDELQAAGQEIQPEYYAKPVLTGLKITSVDGQSEFEPVYSKPKCSDHPDAPHGFNRTASHNAGRYVCECEGWEPDEPVK